MKNNFKSRKIIAIVSSSAGMIQQISQVVSGFVYRTIFLMVLSKEYFGINGLFTSVLQMFSLTELGIGAALLYSMHKHYAADDMEMVRGLVSFYKKVYQLIALVILAIGICFYPFIDSVLDVSEVPADVNLGRVYFLFLIQSVVSYLFAYRKSVLTANQQQYIESLFNSVLLIAGQTVRIVALIIWKNFELLLLLGIVSELLLEWAFFMWIGRRHKDIFSGKGSVSKEEKREVYKNTMGLMCHRLGSIVVTSTDNIVLSKYVSLASVGIYSNYATLISAISGLGQKILFSTQPTITNYVVENSKEDSRTLFFRMLYVNMWAASFTTVCLYLLMNPFIAQIWLDESFLLSRNVVMLICLQHYLQMTCMISGVFINSCGLFGKDKVRPLIESAINLVVSVVLAKKIGIAGVFIGTVVSGLFTFVWRQPYLVLRALGGEHGKYWLLMIFWLTITVAMCLLGDVVFSWIPNTVPGFVLKMLVAGIGSNLMILLLTFRSEGFRYFWGILTEMLCSRRKTDAE